MWSNGFSRTIEIRPGVSAGRLALAVLPALLGVAGIVAAGFPPMAAAVAVIAGTVVAGRTAFAATPWSDRFVHRLVVGGAGEWRVYTTRRGFEIAELRASWIFADGYAAGLAFVTAPGRRLHVILVRSRFPASEWRRLLVRTRRN